MPKPWEPSWRLSFFTPQQPIHQEILLALPVKYNQNPATSHANSTSSWVQATTSSPPPPITATAPLLLSCSCTSSLLSILYAGARLCHNSTQKPCDVFLSHIEQKLIPWQWLTVHSPQLLVPFPLFTLLQFHWRPWSSSNTSGSEPWHWLFFLPARLFPRKLFA